MTIQFREYPPAPDLASSVDTFWEGDFNTSGTEPLTRLVAPNGFVEVIIHLTDAYCRLPDERGDTLRLTDVAYDCGYADQAHFIRDYKRLMGTTPSVFRRERDAYIVNTGVGDDAAAPAAVPGVAATPT